MRGFLALVMLVAACKGSQERSGPAYARAKAELTQIRPRQTIDPATAQPIDPNAVTSQWPIAGMATLHTTPHGVDLSMDLKPCRTSYQYPVAVYEGSDCDA